MKYTLILSLVIVGMFILQLVVPGFTENFLLNKQAFQQPWRFVSSIFLHSGPSHILFNLFALLLFGIILEIIIGSRRFLLVFFISGVIANIFSVFFYDSSLGASGAIFGVIGCLTVLRPLMTVWAFSLPMPLFLAAVLWMAGDVIGVFVPSGIGNWAHLAGLAIGLIIGLLLWKNYGERREKKQRIVVDENYIRAWEDRFVR